MCVCVGNLGMYVMAGEDEMEMEMGYVYSKTRR